MSKRNNQLLLNDIIEAVNNIEEYLKGVSEDEFYSDKKTKMPLCETLKLLEKPATK